jgi:outer membrane protein
VIDLRTPATVNKAKSDLETSKDNLENFKIQLAYQVAQIYYSIIFLNKSLAVQQGQIDLLKSTLNQISVKVNNGDALTYDLVSTQVKYTNAENFFTDLATQMNKQYNLLSMLTGNKGNGYLQDTLVDQATFRTATDSIITMAFLNNPELRITGDKIKSAAWDIVSANRTRLPIVSFMAGLGFKNGFMPEIDAVNFNYYLGAGVTIPILPSSRPGLQKKLAAINLNVSKLSLESQKVSLTKDLQNASDDIQKNEQKLSSADTLIRQALLAQRLASDRYKYGVITNLDLLTSLTNYKDAQLSRLQSEYNLLLSRMELCRLAGVRWW